MSDDLYFNDGWMNQGRLHTSAVDAAAQIISERCDDNLDQVMGVNEFLYHFMSCWYQKILDGKGALVEPAIQSCALFTAHMIEDHGLPPEAQFGCADMLIRFTALVITKCGGKLI